MPLALQFTVPRSLAVGGLLLFAWSGSACGGGGSSSPGGVGGEDGDSGAPRIQDLDVQVLGPDRISVTWTTDKAASAVVEYGTTANLGSSKGSGSGADLDHAVVLDGLQAATLYHLVVVSQDNEENQARVDAGQHSTGGPDAPRLDGELTLWHPLTLTLVGPHAAEADASPNPFLDYSMRVDFVSPTGAVITVPGYFAGDGSGGGAGDRWRVRFHASEPGPWSWTAHMHTGGDVALSLNTDAGTPGWFEGESGNFTVAGLDPGAPGFLKWGRLEDVGGHYLRFRDGPYFLKSGLSSPENLFAYAGFDGTSDVGGAPTGGLTNGLHRYGSHVTDWGAAGLGSVTDPNFSGEGAVDAKGLIGALNYLASRGVNSFCVQVMNLGGDGQDTWPYLTPAGDEEAVTHFDLSKLEQWGVVLEHAQRLGLAVQFVLTDDESANAAWLDGGAVGRQRALLVRELVARFGHLLALEWNLAEGGSLGPSDTPGLAALVDLADPFDHPITSASGDLATLGDDDILDGLTGLAAVTGADLAGDVMDAGEHIERWRTQSEGAARSWSVTHATQNPLSGGLSDTNAEEFRREVLWDVYLSGGQVAFSAGPVGANAGDDLTLEDFRTRQKMLDFAAGARRFLESFVPFWEMEPSDDLLSGASSDYGGGEVFAKHDEVYVIYLPKADRIASLDLTGTSGSFNQYWFNPRTGIFEGAVTTVQGGGLVSLGAPPDATGGDGGAGGAFQEEGGLVVMQVESAPRVDFWGAASSVPGYTGNSYYHWYGNDFFNQPGMGLLTYEIEITNAGNYFLSLYNYHDDPAPDQANDCWVRMDGGTWYKVFSNLGSQTVGVWNWSSRFNHTGQDAQYFLSAGPHTFEISGRSNGFHIDRIHLHQPSVTNPFDLSLPESDRAGDSGAGSDEDWVIGLTR